MKVPLRIRLPFGTENEFIERYGRHVERGGIFIITKAPKPEGTEISFEIVLSNAERLMRGEGVVESIRPGGATEKPGMLVRFVRLDSRSKVLVDKIAAIAEGIGELQPPPPSAPLRPSTPTIEETSDLSAAPTPPGAPPFPSRPEPQVMLTPPALTPRPSAAARAAAATRPSPPPPQPAKPVSLANDVILGIDFGTTGCRAAVFVEGSAQLIPLGKLEHPFLPSIVAVDESGTLVIGERAKSLLSEAPESAAAGFKRVLGRRAKLQEIAARCGFAIAVDPKGNAGVELGGKVFPATELTAVLLRHVKEVAEKRLGRPLTRAVLCVPAWYTDQQRSAMLEAGRLSGLEVLRILNEPTAIALAFGYGRGLARKRLLVYDLGGGTFDASVVEVTGDDLEVVSTGGDNFLGGTDFDRRLVEALLARQGYEARTAIETQRVLRQQLRDGAEAAKIQLSSQDEVTFDVGATTFSFTRDALDRSTGDLVDRTIEITRAVLETAKLLPKSVDEVLLVGGQSRAPLVKRKLEELLGKPARSDVDPQGAVALGAAILGHSLVQKERGKLGVNLSEVLSAPIGVAVQGGGFRRVLERNTRLPADKTLEVPISAGVAMQLAIFQGTAARAEDNEYLGALHVAAPKAGAVAVRFRVSADGRLDLSATGPGGDARVSFSTEDASDATRATLLASAPLPGEQDAGKRGLLSGLKRLWNRA